VGVAVTIWNDNAARFASTAETAVTAYRNADDETSAVMGQLRVQEARISRHAGGVV
jgi:hypothetical protein